MKYQSFRLKEQKLFFKVKIFKNKSKIYFCLKIHSLLFFFFYELSL